MEFALTVANIHLVTMSFLFASLRLSELALANTFALVFLNANMTNRPAYIFNLFLCGLATFVMGYPYFLTANKNHGVYLHLLGILVMLYASYLHTEEILLRYREEYQAQDEEQEELEAIGEEESEEE